MYKIHRHSPEVETYEITLLIHFIQGILSTTRLSDWRLSLDGNLTIKKRKQRKKMHALSKIHAPWYPTSLQYPPWLEIQQSSGAGRQSAAKLLRAHRHRQSCRCTQTPSWRPSGSFSHRTLSANLAESSEFYVHCVAECANLANGGKIRSTKHNQKQGSGGLTYIIACLCFSVFFNVSEGIYKQNSKQCYQDNAFTSWQYRMER